MLLRGGTIQEIPPSLCAGVAAARLSWNCVHAEKHTEYFKAKQYHCCNVGRGTTFARPQLVRVLLDFFTPEEDDTYSSTSDFFAASSHSAWRLACTPAKRALRAETLSFRVSASVLRVLPSLSDLVRGSNRYGITVSFRRRPSGCRPATVKL